MSKLDAFGSVIVFCRLQIRHDSSFAHMAMGQNLWLHFVVDDYPFATSFDAHQGYYRVLTTTAIGMSKGWFFGYADGWFKGSGHGSKGSMREVCPASHHGLRNSAGSREFNGAGAWTLEPPIKQGIHPMMLGLPIVKWDIFEGPSRHVGPTNQMCKLLVQSQRAT